MTEYWSNGIRKLTEEEKEALRPLERAAIAELVAEIQSMTGGSPGGDSDADAAIEQSRAVVLKT